MAAENGESWKLSENRKIHQPVAETPCFYNPFLEPIFVRKHRASPVPRYHARLDFKIIHLSRISVNFLSDFLPDSLEHLVYLIVTKFQQFARKLAQFRGLLKSVVGDVYKKPLAFARNFPVPKRWEGIRYFWNCRLISRVHFWVSSNHQIFSRSFCISREFLFISWLYRSIYSHSQPLAFLVVNFLDLLSRFVIAVFVGLSHPALLDSTHCKMAKQPAVLWAQRESNILLTIEVISYKFINQ